MSKETIKAKADRYLTEGRVTVKALTSDKDLQTLTALVHVVGDSGGDPYYVRYDDEVWACDCPARVSECAHVMAARKVVLGSIESIGEVVDSAELDELLGRD